jgi:hypothetical protein
VSTSRGRELTYSLLQIHMKARHPPPLMLIPMLLIPTC